MSDFYNDLMTGLNESVAIERGELKVRKTVYEFQIIRTSANNQNKEEVIQNELDDAI